MDAGEGQVRREPAPPADVTHRPLLPDLSHWAAVATSHVSRSAHGAPMDRALRVTLNFHPDRLTGGATVLENLATDGRYRNQFETGTSNGGLTARVGGSRWRWEQRIFGGAYDDAPAEERPKYGALNHRRRSVGAAVRFGSAHLRLAEHVLSRTTCIPSDVEAVVLDPCYRETPIEEQAFRLGVAVEWHEGRVLDIEELARHPDYRGEHIVEVGRRIAERGDLTALVLGRAVVAGHEDPQDLKKVWHHIARFGQPSRK